MDVKQDIKSMLACRIMELERDIQLYKRLGVADSLKSAEESLKANSKIYIRLFGVLTYKHLVESPTELRQ